MDKDSSQANKLKDMSHHAKTNKAFVIGPTRLLSMKSKIKEFLSLTTTSTIILQRITQRHTIIALDKTSNKVVGMSIEAI